MKILYKNANIYDTQKKAFVLGELFVDSGVIVDFEHCDGATVVDLGGAYLIPGLIDLHTHGRAGGDFVSADAELLLKMSRSYLESGVTSVMATLASAPLNELYAACTRIAEAKEKGAENIVGIHLEGRYLNEKRRGAHAAELLAIPDAKELEGLIAEMKSLGSVHVSTALELDKDGSFTEAALRHGATLGLAHTNATYAEAQAAFDRGAVALTHTYNAMSPFHHRDGGAVGAGLLNDAVYCELIVDGFHVAPEAVLMAYRLKGDKLVLITDSMEATGMEDGEYSIAGLPVTVKDGKARTHEGAIAGSTLTLIDGVKNLAAFTGISFEEAVYHATAAPAKMVGIYDSVGSLEVGKQANMLVLDKEYNVLEVIFRGEKI